MEQELLINQYIIKSKFRNKINDLLLGALQCSDKVKIYRECKTIVPFFSGAQPKAGTGHKMQSISVVFSTLHCEGYIADLRYRGLITFWSPRFYPPFWKARGMEDSQQKDYSFLGNDTFTMHKFMNENLRVNIWRDNFTSDYLKCTEPPNFFSAEMKLCNIHIKNLIILSVSGNFEGFKNWQKVAEICYQLVHDRVSRGLALFGIDVTHLHGINSLWTCMQISLWRQFQNRPKPFTSSVMRQRVSNFRLYCSSKKFQMLRKNVKSLLEQFQVCIFAEIVFGARCTLGVNLPSRNLSRIIRATYQSYLHWLNLPS